MNRILLSARAGALIIGAVLLGGTVGWAGTVTAGARPVGYSVSADPSGWPSEEPSGEPSGGPSEEPSGGPSDPGTPGPATTGFTGHFLTAAGRAVSDGWVDALDPTSYAQIAEAQTSDIGAYTLAVKPGRYILEFSEWGHGTQYAHGKTDPWNADQFTVRAGELTTVDEYAIPSGTIQGRLIDAQGNPVSGASVETMDASGDTRIRTTTGDDGTYTAGGIPTGRYHVGFELPANFWAAQWSPRQVDPDKARWFDIGADQTVTVDEQFLPTATISGTVADAAGKPLSRAQLNLTGLDQRGAGWASADADGAFRIEVFPGSYKLSFQTSDFNRTQWFVGARTFADATTLTAVAGKDLSVSDRLLPTGDVRVSAVDAVSGAPVAGLCAIVDTVPDQVCADGTGPVLLHGAVVGKSTVHAWTPDGRHFDGDTTATIVAGRAVDVTVRLKPAAVIRTVIRDSATGKPVPRACVSDVPATDAMLPDSWGACSDDNGVVTIGPLPTADKKLFVNPPGGTEYGRQWVGAHGGTGEARKAAVVHARVGQVAQAPDIRLDKGGTITGTVTAKAGGRPLTGGVVGLSAFHPGVGPVQAVDVDATGHFTIDHLGPYPWPLFFEVGDEPAQWSGAVPSRLDAKLVAVKSGKTTTYDQALVDGATVTGSTSDNDDWIVAVNTSTGDVAGSGWSAGGHYTMRVLGPQCVYLVGRENKRLSGPVSVPAHGTTTVNLP